MPLINVIPGDKIPTAPFNVRVPVWRVPGWLVALWWLLRGLTRLTVLAVRYWWLTAPTLAATWVRVRYGWPTLGVVVLVLVAVGVGWWRLHPASWLRFGWYPLVGRWRRLWVYRRRWSSVMTTCGLATAFAGDRYVPQLLAVRCDRFGDRATVRMLPGQIPDDWGQAAERLAYAFRLRDGRAASMGRPDRVVLHFNRRDPLAGTVAPLPVPEVPDLAGLALGVREDGQPYRLRLAGSHVLIAGATNSGKGSVIWSLIRSLAGGIRSGLVELWAFDPKGGMELAAGVPLFARFAYDDPDSMAGVLEEAVKRMRQRAARLRGVTRQHVPTPDDPLLVLVVDELAALTAYITDRKVRDRIRESLGLLLSQGRAVGVHVIAALQDPRKDVLPFRDLFPTRIGLRMTEPEQADMVLGDGARDRGAVCDRIPETSPGVGFVVLDGLREPVRVRFSYLTDDDIRQLGRDHRRLCTDDTDNDDQAVTR
jgi:S-DNA-T family DNA segregation ATPase FtsK/SpoIIIE